MNPSTFPLSTLIPLSFCLPAVTLDDWRAKFFGIGVFEADRLWIYGDLFLECKNLIDLDPGQFYTFAQIAFKICAVLPKVGIPHRDWIDWGYVADEFPPAARAAGVKWEHHRHLAYADIPREQRADWLTKAFANEWTVADLRAAMATPADGPQLKGMAGVGLVPRKIATDALRCLRLWKETHPADRLRPEELTRLWKDFAPLYDELTDLSRRANPRKS